MEAGLDLAGMGVEGDVEAGGGKEAAGVGLVGMVEGGVGEAEGAKGEGEGRLHIQACGRTHGQTSKASTQTLGCSCAAWVTSYTDAHGEEKVQSFGL